MFLLIYLFIYIYVGGSCTHVHQLQNRHWVLTMIHEKSRKITVFVKRVKNNCVFTGQLNKF